MPEVYVSGVWYPLPHDPEAGQWGRRPEPPPPSASRHLGWFEYYCCFVFVFGVYVIALQFRGFLLPSSPVPSSWTALALLPTCPAPAMPPVCYDERSRLDDHSVCCNCPMLIRRDGHGGDYKSAKKCFDGLLRDAAWTCHEQEGDYKAAMKCFDSLLRDAARICFVWSYDDIPLTRQSDDPPPT